MISDQDKTKEQLIAELAELRQQVNPSRQAEQALKESKNLFRAIADYTCHWENLVGLDGKLLWVNPGVEKITGYSREEYLNMPDRLKQIILDDDQDRIRSHFENGIKHNKSADDVEFRIRRKDGSSKWVSLSYQPIYSDEGECLGLRSSMRDIDKRKQAQEQLLAANIFLDSLMENLPVAVFVKEIKELRYRFWNKASENYIGIAKQDVIGKTDYEVFDSETAGRLTAIDRTAAENGELINIPEERIEIPRWGTRFFRSKKIPMVNQQGLPEYILGIAENITEQRQTEIALQESEEKYRTLMNDSTDAILLADDEGNIFEINKQARALLGYTAQELTGINVRQLHPEQELNAIIAKVKSSLLPQGTWSLNDVQVQKKDGTMVPVDIRGRFIDCAGKRIIQGVLRDISERKAAEAELEKYRLHLEKRVKARTAELTTLNLQLRQEIEERIKAEDALRRSEEQFRSVIETSSDAIITADSSGNITLWNRGAEEIYGYTAEEMLNNPFIQIMPEQLQESHWRQFTSFMEERKPRIIVSQGELHGRRKDGSVFPSEGSAALWETREGVFITSLIRDVSKRKMAERALKDSEERFRNLAQTATDAIIIIASDGTIVFWNNSAEHIYGYTEEEVLGKMNSLLVPEQFRHASDQYFDLLSRNSPPAAPGRLYESFARRKNGSTFPVEVALSTWRMGDETFYCVMLRDITERIKTAQVLRESEEKFRTMTENIPSAIIIHQDTHLVYINPAAEALSGYTNTELQGMNALDIIHPDFREQMKDWGLRRLAGEELPLRYELKIISKNGKERWLDHTAAVIEFNGRKALMGTGVDITERKQAEEALRQSEERYRMTAEHIPIHLGAIDQSGKFILWNSYSEKLFGYTRDEAINKLSPSAIMQGKEVEDEVLRITAETGKYDNDLELRKKDGSLFPGHLIVVPDNTNGGRINGFYGFVEDITQRKRAEELIKNVNDCLLGFSADPDKNIQSIIDFARTIFDGASAAYHKIKDDLLHIATSWNLAAEHIHPPRTKTRYFEELYARYGDSPFIISNFNELPSVPKDSTMLQMGFNAFIATPVKVEDRLVGSLNVAFEKDKSFSPNELNIFSILAKAISIEEERKNVLEDLKRHQLQLDKSEKSLKAFSGRLLSIREEEQKNISSALHDELGSMVVAISSGLTIAKEEILENNPEPALKSIERTEAALSQAVESLKKIAIDLRPPNLEIVGLSNALSSYFATIARQTKIAIEFSDEVEDIKLDDAIAITLYRTAQESLNNVLKHAKANNVTIRLYEKGREILFEVADNGRGFDPEAVSASPRAAAKIGIQGMRERIAALGGALSIESAPQKGTTLRITIPKQRGKKKWK